MSPRPSHCHGGPTPGRRAGDQAGTRGLKTVTAAHLADDCPSSNGHRAVTVNVSEPGIIQVLSPTGIEHGVGPGPSELHPANMVDPVSTAYVLFLVVSHMTVSSTMLILNKAVLVLLPVATTVLLAQVGSSAVILWILGKAKILTVDGFELKTVRSPLWRIIKNKTSHFWIGRE